MIVTLILLILLVVFLAFFVGFNLSNTCTFWFFKTFTELPVSILVFISFAAGILVALLFFFMFKLKEPSQKEKVREGVQSELEKMEKRNKKLRGKQGKSKVETEAAKASTDISVSETKTAEKETVK